MQRIEEAKQTLDLYTLKDMEKEYIEMYTEQVRTLLKSSNWIHYNSNYSKLEEIERFKDIIKETIEEVEYLICK